MKNVMKKMKYSDNLPKNHLFFIVFPESGISKYLFKVTVRSQNTLCILETCAQKMELVQQNFTTLLVKQYND